MSTTASSTLRPATTPQPSGTPLAGYAVAVDVGGIEKELAALWRTQSKEKSQALTRACSWNLVVHCSDDAALTLGKTTADALIHSVPTRTVLVKNEPYTTGGKEIEAWVSANCQVAPGGGKLLCTEEIHIESHGKGVEHVPSLLRALVVPDVPTALWWAGAPPDNAAAVRMLLSGVDRLIVDSQAATGGNLSKLAHVGGLLDGMILADLNWMRTGSLRSLLAAMFDPPTGHEALYKMKRMRLDVSDTGVAAAKLMLGWLTSRLKWTVQEKVSRNGGLAWRVLSRDENVIAIDVEVSGTSAGGRASGIRALGFETSEGERYGFQSREGSVVDLITPSGGREVTAAEPPLEQLLVAALGARGRDKLYGVALHRAMELER